MKLKGIFNSGTTYNIGDAVKWEDGHIYHLQRAAKAGTTPADTFYWGRTDQIIEQSALFALDALTAALDAVSAVSATIPQNISDEAITLKGSEDAEYLITVDDSGDTPELEVTLIEEEADEGGEGGES